MRFDKGKPIPLTIEEKTSVALQLALNANPDWSDCATWATGFSIEKSSDTPIDTNKSRYKVSGTASIGRKHREKAMILIPVDITFDITFVDSKDNWGLPDVSIEQYKFKLAK